MFEFLKSRWATFEYNYVWDDYTSYLNGYPAKAASLVPLIGYLVLFNDAVLEKLKFTELAGDVKTFVFLNPDFRNQLIFLGLFFLAVANFLYRVWRPWVIRYGESLSSFSDRAMKEFTYSGFVQLHAEIRAANYVPWTQEGKYYDDDWNLFSRDAIWKDSGRGVLEIKQPWEIKELDRVNFAEAKRKHESLLRSILRETYFAVGRTRRTRLSICLIVATIGYILLLFPSADLCLRVLQVIATDILASTFGT